MAELKYTLLNVTMDNKEIIFIYDIPFPTNHTIEYEIITDNKRKIITIQFYIIYEDERILLKSYYGENEYNRNTIFLFGCYKKECIDQNIQKRVKAFIEHIRPNTYYTVNSYIDPNSFEPINIIDYLEFETLEDKNLFKELIL